MDYTTRSGLTVEAVEKPKADKLPRYNDGFIAKHVKKHPADEKENGNA